MEHDRFYMVDISLQVKELLCLFKEAHVSIRTQVFCPSPKGNSYQALNNASIINKLRTLVCLELVMQSHIMENPDCCGMLGCFCPKTS
jgi:hypothetical protein